MRLVPNYSGDVGTSTPLNQKSNIRKEDGDIVDTDQSTARDISRQSITTSLPGEKSSGNSLHL